MAVHVLEVPNGQSLKSPVSLGAFPHECLGNIKLCPDGFTVGFWYKAIPGKADEPVRYVLSSGGQSSMSEGFYVRQNYGKDYEVGVAKGTTQWKVRLFLHDDVIVYFVLTWSEQGLDVYIDGVLAGSDAKGTTRIYSSPAFNPFPNLVVGWQNDKSYTGKSIDEYVVNVTHWDIFYHQEDVDDLAGIKFIYI